MPTASRKTYVRHNIAENGPNPVDVHVGQKLRARRALVGMTQQDLAEATKITFQQVQKYETGKNRTSASRLFQFARLLETPVDYFFEGLSATDSKIGIQPGFADNSQAEYDAAPVEEDIMQRKETINLVRAYYAIEDETLRKDFLKMLKQMSKTVKTAKPAKKPANK
jgi:transcriptional regulator with XRE-family HTH domain